MTLFTYPDRDAIVMVAMSVVVTVLLSRLGLPQRLNQRRLLRLEQEWHSRIYVDTRLWRDRTLLRSWGIPRSLRSSSLPDVVSMIANRGRYEYAPADSASGGRIFISYAYSDGSSIARQLVSQLEQVGVSCWMGQRDLNAGQDFPPQIVRAVRECRALVVVVTDGANGSRDVLQEVSLGHNAKKPVLPLIIRNATPSEGLAYYIGIVQQISWSDAQTVAATVRAVLAGA